MNRRENTLRCYRFQRPASIPVRVVIPPQAWLAYDPHELAEILGSHTVLFPDFVPGSVDPRKLALLPHQRPGERFTDAWGCAWENSPNGLDATVVKHPVGSWDQLPKLRCPDPTRSDGLCPLNWEQLKRHAEACWHQKRLLQFDLPAGHTLLRLRDLRGYENLMFDMLDGHADLPKLIQIVTDFNTDLVRRYVDLEPDILGIPEDLGMQNMPLVSPEQFRTFLKASYAALAQPAKEKGVLVHHRCGGYMLDLVDDLVEAGVDILSIEDRVNGLDEIRTQVKGRAAIELDLDRHVVTQTGTPLDIKLWIAEAHTKLADENGGFAMVYHVRPPTPIDNIRAVCDALEEFSTFYPSTG